MSVTTTSIVDVAPPFVLPIYGGPPADLMVAPVFDVAFPFVLPDSVPPPAPTRRFAQVFAARPVILSTIRRVVPDKAEPGTPPTTP